MNAKLSHAIYDSVLSLTGTHNVEVRRIIEREPKVYVDGQYVQNIQPLPDYNSHECDYYRPTNKWLAQLLPDIIIYCRSKITDLELYCTLTEDDEITVTMGENESIVQHEGEILGVKVTWPYAKRFVFSYLETDPMYMEPFPDHIFHVLFKCETPENWVIEKNPGPEFLKVFGDYHPGTTVISWGVLGYKFTLGLIRPLQFFQDFANTCDIVSTIDRIFEIRGRWIHPANAYWGQAILGHFLNGAIVGMNTWWVVWLEEAVTLLVESISPALFVPWSIFHWSYETYCHSNNNNIALGRISAMRLHGLIMFLSRRKLYPVEKYGLIGAWSKRVYLHLLTNIISCAIGTAMAEALNPMQLTAWDMWSAECGFPMPLQVAHYQRYRDAAGFSLFDNFGDDGSSTVGTALQVIIPNTVKAALNIPKRPKKNNNKKQVYVPKNKPGPNNNNPKLVLSVPADDWLYDFHSYLFANKIDVEVSSKSKFIYYKFQTERVLVDCRAEMLKHYKVKEIARFHQDQNMLFDNLANADIIVRDVVKMIKAVVPNAPSPVSNLVHPQVQPPQNAPVTPPQNIIPPSPPVLMRDVSQWKKALGLVSSDDDSVTWMKTINKWSLAASKNKLVKKMPVLPVPKINSVVKVPHISPALLSQAKGNLKAPHKIFGKQEFIKWIWYKLSTCLSKPLLGKVVPTPKGEWRQFGRIISPILIWELKNYSRYRINNDLIPSKITDVRFDSNSHGDFLHQAELGTYDLELAVPAEPTWYNAWQFGLGVLWRRCYFVKYNSLLFSKEQLKQLSSPSNVVYTDSRSVIWNRQKVIHQRSSTVNIDKNFTFEHSDVHNHTLALSSFKVDHHFLKHEHVLERLKNLNL